MTIAAVMETGTVYQMAMVKATDRFPGCGRKGSEVATLQNGGGDATRGEEGFGPVAVEGAVEEAEDPERDLVAGIDFPVVGDDVAVGDVFDVDEGLPFASDSEEVTAVDEEAAALRVGRGMPGAFPLVQEDGERFACIADVRRGDGGGRSEAR